VSSVVGAQDWHGLEEFFFALAVILIIAGVICYFYQTSYVTWLGTFYDYPYRSYTTGLAIGTVFCFIASYVSYSIATDMEVQSRQVQVQTAQLPHSVTVTLKYCGVYGAQVPVNANYCPKCANPLN
jgi:hypothetical protein